MRAARGRKERPEAAIWGRQMPPGAASAEASPDTTETLRMDQKFRKAQSVQAEKLILDPAISEAHTIYTLQKKKFVIYISALEPSDTKKVTILIKRLDYTTYEYIENLSTFDKVITKLDQNFQTKTNDIFARWQLNNQKQPVGQTVQTIFATITTTS